ncbi:MAG: carboxypeptidase regulatory-like domain-containing protein [Lysobacterales bacterium]
MSTRNGRKGLSVAIRYALLGLGSSLAPAVGTALLISAVPVQSAFAQQTSSSLSGSVTAEDGSPVVNASVVLIHQPSGTRSEAFTGDTGNFFQGGLRVGGPYQLIISADGYRTSTVDEIFLRPGTQPAMRLSMESSSTQALDAIVVSADREATRDLNSGVGSTYTSVDISNQPASRRDVIRTLLRDPLASSRGEGNLSVAGANPRFNGLSIDGALQQDDFGLGSNTYATNRSPINLDAVESASLVASDYSVTATGFTGGLVNIVTKSGGNEFDGSAFYYYLDEDFLGDEYGEDGERDFNAAPFKEREYGVTLSGPIIKDKLFFFVSYDEFKSSSTTDFSVTDENNGVQPGFFDALRGVIQDTYGYDPGTRATQVSNPITSERALVKLDWNISDDHRASYTYQSTEESGTVTGALNFESAWYDTPVDLTAHTLQIFSDWSPSFSTTFRYNNKEFQRDQLCRAGAGIGALEFDLNPANGGLAGTPLDGLLTQRRTFIAGCDRFRHANLFNDERTQVFLSGDWYYNDHVWTFGAEYEEFDVFNLFVGSSTGRFRFNSFDQIVNRTGRVEYANAISNNVNDAASAWGYEKYSYFLQDTWTVTPNFEVTLGFRLEEFSQDDRPVFNQQVFSDYGVRNDVNVDGNKLFMPRLGFRWTPLDRTVVTGGLGIFAGGDPKVWISNAFQPATVFAAQSNLTNLDPRVIPSVLIDTVSNGTPVVIDSIDPDFRTPNDLKASLRWDQGFDMQFGGLDLGTDYTFTAQYLYSRVREGFLWTNLAQTDLPAAQPTGVAPDGRPIYADLDALRINNLTQLGNFDGGSSHTISLSLAKRWENGFDAEFSYARQNIEDTTEGTSSRGISNWRGIVAVDRNNPSARTSPFQIEDAFKLSIGYEKAFFGDYKTRFDLFGQAYSGTPYTYTFDVSNTNSLFGRAGQGEGPFDNSPLYIPSPGVDPSVVYSSGFDTQAFFDFVAREGIETGKIHEVNSKSSRWIRQWDLRIQQELPGIPGMDKIFGDNKLKLVLDVDNLGNLLNSKWGNFYNGPGNNQQPNVQADLVTRADVAANGIDGATALTGDAARIACSTQDACVYRFNDFTDRASSSLSPAQSVYRIRIGIRYDF